MFSPKEEYQVLSKQIELRDIREYPDQFILRPPYQRHAGVWKNKMKEQLLDSVCRNYYVPKIVLRKIRLDKETEKWEVIDGQQRLCTILDFFDKKHNLKLPNSLQDLALDIVNKKYYELSPDKRKWFDKLSISADLILNIEDKNDPKHQKKAAELFYRLQQSEPLTFIEVLHSKLDSNVRNFVSKYADTTSFDFDQYLPLDENRNIHPFFGEIIDISNNRMQYLLLLTRFLMIEFEEGPTDVGDKSVMSFFNKYLVENEANEVDKDFGSKPAVKACLTNLNSFYEIFKNNSMIDNNNGVKYIKKDYYILSLYLLLRHLKRHYVFEGTEHKLFDKFSAKFYTRLIKNDENDFPIMQFRDNRQQSKENLEARDRIMRVVFFNESPGMLTKDSKRIPNEAEKIEIYNRDRGICKECLNEFIKQGLPENEAEQKAKVSWKDYEADHIIPWIKGGKTSVKTMQVLCNSHNSQKGSSL